MHLRKRVGGRNGEREGGKEGFVQANVLYIINKTHDIM